jgi:thioredoxin 1
MAHGSLRYYAGKARPVTSVVRRNRGGQAFVGREEQTAALMPPKGGFLRIRTFHITVATVATLALSTIGALQAQSKMAPTAPMNHTDDMAGMNTFKPFTKEAFNAAAAAGKTTLVFFHAPWCPVCKAQEPKIQAHLDGDAKQVVPFIVDYDTNKALRQEMHVSKQSTLILYQGTKEVARLSYKSDDASIDELFSHASMAMSKMAEAH